MHFKWVNFYVNHISIKVLKNYESEVVSQPSHLLQLYFLSFFFCVFCFYTQLLRKNFDIDCLFAPPPASYIFI